MWWRWLIAAAVFVVLAITTAIFTPGPMPWVLVVGHSCMAVFMVATAWDRKQG